MSTKEEQLVTIKGICHAFCKIMSKDIKVKHRGREKTQTFEFWDKETKQKMGEILYLESKHGTLVDYAFCERYFGDLVKDESEGNILKT